MPRQKKNSPKEVELKSTPGLPALRSKAKLPEGNMDVSQFTASADSLDIFKGEGFEDLSLPPIIKSKALKENDVIIGEIQTFSGYRQGQIDSALVTLHILKAGKDGLEKVGVRGALPVGAVLGRALGAGSLFQDGGKPKFEAVIDAIKAAGFVEGTILAMRYRGTGKERDNMNAPHLWDIKAKRPDGATMAATADRAKPKKSE